MKLLSRDEFRNGCMQRDNNRCVFCKATNDLCVHHILERRLFPDGGYYLENGATICPTCHILCEQTEISVEDARLACNIKKTKLPPHLYDDLIYDKWGNIIVDENSRLKGELFHDESVQKILKEGNKLDLFQSNFVKYPRTNHLPWSPGMNKDDRLILSMDAFEGKRVIATVKMDGENTTMYNNHIHARSVDSGNHLSRNYVKRIWSNIMGDIPEGWRVCGENLYAQHSIRYEELPSYFMGFSIWNSLNCCLSWDETQEWFQLLGIHSVPVLYDGIYDEKRIKELWNEKNRETQEGYVLRTADGFPQKDFKNCVAKFVRKNHVNSDSHWMHKTIVANGLMINS